MDLKELTSNVDQETHWYYQTKKLMLLRFFARCLPKSGRTLDVVDIGAGSGFFSRELERLHGDHIGRIIMVDTGYTEEEAAATQEGGKIRKVRELPGSMENSLIILMDVLEHIEDESGLLSEIRKRASRSYFFLTVPAFQFLWSHHDEYLGHRRRYTRRSLESILAGNRFEVAGIYYSYGLILPLVYLYRKLRTNRQEGRSDLKAAPPVLNSLLTRVIGLEMRMTRMNKLAGLTCVAEGLLS